MYLFFMIIIYLLFSLQLHIITTIIHIYMANTYRFTDIFSKKNQILSTANVGRDSYSIYSYHIYSIPIYDIPLEALCTIINTTKYYIRW